MKFEVTVEKVDGYGPEATAWTWLGVMGDVRQGREWVSFKYDMRLVDTFVKTKSGWQVRSSTVW